MNKRNDQIDLLRGFAIIFVVLHHSNWFRMLVPSQFHQSWAGVELFFGISGYVVTKSLFRIIDRFPKSFLLVFWKRRLCRIFPTTIISLLIFALVRLIFEEPNEIWQSTKFAIQGVLLFNFNFVSISLGKQNFYGGLWSLVVEEQFYLILPLLFVFLKFNKNLITVFLFSICCIVILFLRTKIPTVNWMYDRFHTFLKVDCLSLGVLVSVLNPVLKLNIRIAKLVQTISLILIAILPGIYVVEPHNTFGFVYNIISLLVILLLILAINFEESNPMFLLKPIIFLGRRSLSIYLIHPIIFYIFRTRNMIGNNFSEYLTYFLITCVLAIIASEIFYRFIEIPITKLANSTKNTKNF